MKPNRLPKVPLMLAAALLTLNLSMPRAIAGIESPTGHGMLVIGKDTIYLSHLPMYSLPHRYQIILEVELKRSGQNIGHLYRNDREKPGNENMIYTLNPDEMFVLPNQVLSLEPFKATVFRGHFERGGQAFLTDVTVEIKRIVYFRQLKSSDTPPGEMDFDEYLLFGKRSELFLAHWINGRPNYDHILKVRHTSRSLSDTELSSGVLIRVHGRLKPNDKVKAHIGDLRRDGAIPVDIEIGEEYYLEVGELS